LRFRPDSGNLPAVSTPPVKFEPPPPASVNPDDAAAAAFLQEHLRRLRALPAHGNRALHFDQLFLALLPNFYDPSVRPPRLIEDRGDFDGRLDLDRLARSTTADALAVFDPIHLKPIIADSRAGTGHVRADESLAGITRRILAADGTYINTLADVARALRQTRRDGRGHGQARINVQMDAHAWTPRVVSVGGDDGSEPDAFARDPQSDALYVVDRNFVDFAFLRQLLEKDNHFVPRVRSNAPAVEGVAERPPTPADAEAGVAGDQTVTPSGQGAPEGQFRLVVLRAVDRSGKPETIRLPTSLTGAEVSARVVGEVYRLRRQAEG